MPPVVVLWRLVELGWNDRIALRSITIPTGWLLGLSTPSTSLFFDPLRPVAISGVSSVFPKLQFVVSVVSIVTLFAQIMQYLYLLSSQLAGDTDSSASEGISAVSQKRQLIQKGRHLDYNWKGFVVMASTLHSKSLDLNNVFF